MMKKMLKDTMKVGIGSMAGLGIMGSMGNIPNMPVNNIPQITSASMNIINVGQMGKNAVDISKMMSQKKKYKW